MTKPELIIFDCDGVLIDSEGLALKVLAETLGDYGISLTVEEAIQRYVGLSEASEQADIESRYQIKLSPNYFAKKQMRQVQVFEAQLKPMPGVIDFLDALPFKKCVASSSSFERLRHSLGLVGLWDRFAPHIFSSEQVKNGKPAPDLFLFAADQMKTPPSACLVIEDSIAGVRAAKAANIRVFGFTGGSHCDAMHGERLLSEGAEKVFNKMEHIAEILL